MDDSASIFNWLDFSEGRVRYAGGAKGRDEPPIESFAVELFGKEYYGEIRKLFISDATDYRLEIVSFGWPSTEWFGEAPDVSRCAAFLREELASVQSLICKAIDVWRHLATRPFVLTEYSNSRFQGEVTFREGWALVNA